jgi:large subunit ribosomal protein L21
MKYAVIRLKGHQHKISEKDEFLVDFIGEAKPEFETLLVVDGEKTKIGTPTVKNAKITLKNLGEERGKKMHVKKYKAKSRYRRKIGFRPKYTKLQVTKITLA